MMINVQVAEVLLNSKEKKKVTSKYKCLKGQVVWPGLTSLRNQATSVQCEKK